MHFRKPDLITEERHTMGSALYPYLKMKMHHLLDEEKYDCVKVVGLHDREGSVVSTREKSGKITNWQRPTAMIENGELTVYCYPGKDYVRHYAVMINSYLNGFGQVRKTPVTYALPSEEFCMQTVRMNGLSHVDIQKTVIIGFALDAMFPNAQFEERRDFYHAIHEVGGEPVSLVVVKHSFWGDILGRFGTRLVELGAENIYFTGKVGGTHESLIPNVSLATGSSTYVEGEWVEWDNLVDSTVLDNLCEGSHITSPSVMYETKEWLSQMASKFHFVDPEVGQIARAVARQGKRFGYVHIVSNTLLGEADENLSNERDAAVLNKRTLLIEQMRSVLSNAVEAQSQ